MQPYYGFALLVPQESVLGPLLFNVFVYNFCNVIKRSNYLLSADDMKNFWEMKSPQDCSLLQIDIDSTCDLCTSNHTKLNIILVKLELFNLLGKQIRSPLSINCIYLLLYVQIPSRSFS